MTRIWGRRISKRGWLWLLAYLIFLLSIISGELLLRSQDLQPAETRPITIYFDNSSDQTKFQPEIEKYLKDKGLIGRPSNIKTAELIIGPNALKHSLPISSTSTGVPEKLSGEKIVQAQSNTNLYLGTQLDKIAGTDASAFIKPLAKALQPSSNQQWTLNAIGDIIEGRYVYRAMRVANDFTLPFSKVHDRLKSTDVTLANLECTIADGIPYPEEGFTFNSPAKAMAGLTESGIDAVNLANNHSFTESVGFNGMLNNLTANGIAYFGGGQNATEAHTPKIITTHGLKIAVLGYDAIPGTPEATDTTEGVAVIKIKPWYPFDESYIQAMEADIKKAKSQADMVFVYYHWGTEYTHDANDEQREVAHRAIDAGADLILGTHPHWVQGIEWYKDKLITYSLGNFVFDQEWSVPTTQGTMLTATFDGTKLIEATLTPYQITNYSTPGWLDLNSDMAHTILNDVYAHSWWPIPNS
ncbi:MAG TPA: CapA family protein [Candidatus Saccharimonadales bacterium]|nr:CapA family protein [Candidatus Saccharimonadales bacterium]